MSDQRSFDSLQGSIEEVPVPAELFIPNSVRTRNFSHWACSVTDPYIDRSETSHVRLVMRPFVEISKTNVDPSGDRKRKTATTQGRKGHLPNHLYPSVGE